MKNNLIDILFVIGTCGGVSYKAKSYIQNYFCSSPESFVESGNEGILSSNWILQLLRR